MHNIDWAGPRSDGIHPDFYETMEGHCKYAFLASPEGLSYSGRLKYLLNCESVSCHLDKSLLPASNLMPLLSQVIFIRTIEHLVHFSHLLNYTKGDLQNVVMLPPRDGKIVESWRNAEGEMKALLKDEVRAKQIAARSAEVFRDRFLSPAAVSCYWRVSLSSRKFEAFADLNFVLLTDRNL